MSTVSAIELWPRVYDCCLCGCETTDAYSVGFYCEPTKDAIGTVTTKYSDGGIVGGMSACKPCHDAFYGDTQDE